MLLRPFKPEDLDPYAEMVADKEVMQYATYDGVPMTRAQAWNWLCLMLGHWHMRGFGLWAIEEKNTGDLLGRVGLQFLDWFDDVELVWMLKLSAWGKGFAAEGARATINYGMEILELPRVTSVIHTENQPSIRLAERLGLIRERELERQNILFIEYSYSSEQHLKNQGKGS
ncbi:MAG: GNAT family N-acetyltransferase [Anaerolineales bacterium]|nr:GNAT family N-acetyltransferase [Anaerolineales bacterium]